MIKVLVVDDEKLVRKGILNIIDWNKYDMSIVGEAENGRVAMTFLHENQVDLILTDWSMPGLSGIKFLEQVKADFPRIHIVVLTMHQEFTYIQQAMSLGVTDYITKSQLERENVESIMENIVRKLNYDAGALTYERNYNKIRSLNDGVILYSYFEEPKKLLSDVTKNKFEKIYRIGDRFWYAINKNIEVPTLPKNVLAIKIFRATKPSYIEALKRLQLFITVDLFYLYKKDVVCYSLNLAQNNFAPIDKDFEKSDVLKGFKTLLWITDDNVFQELLKRIVELRLTKDELSVFSYQLYVQWSSLTHKNIAGYFDEVSGFAWWEDWVNWFLQNRKLLSQKNVTYCDSGDNVMVMRKALDFIKSNFDGEVTLEDLLKLTNMSKSHFCKCFKQMFNTTFLNYLKEYRVEKSKEYLLNTAQPIYWVAEKVGYQNEKYFKFVFQEITGMSPKEFRNINAS